MNACCELKQYPEMDSRASASDGKFSFSQIFDYLKTGSYPDNFDKSDKRGLRKRAAFFVIKDTKLYYTAGK